MKYYISCSHWGMKETDEAGFYATWHKEANKFVCLETDEYKHLIERN